MKKLLFRTAAVVLLLLILFSFAGCAAFSPEPAETTLPTYPESDDSEPRPEDVDSNALKILKNHFGDNRYEGGRTGTFEYTIIDNYWDLEDIYDFAKIDWVQKGYGFCGNVRDAEASNLYSPEYFETGYIIAFAYIGSSGSFEFECEAVKSADGIAVNANCIEPLIQTTDIGAYVYLIAVEGKYADEKVTVNVTHTVIESTPG